MRSYRAAGCLAVVTLFACGNGKGSDFGGDTPDAGGDGDPNDPFADVQIVGTDGTNQMNGCIPDPGNFEVPMNNCDDDGDGQIDNVAMCDNGTLQMAGDANAFAKSIGLCQTATGGKWGVVSAAYTQGYMNASAPGASQHGILKKFGAVVKPREGKSFGLLSSGWADEYDCGMMATFKGGCQVTGTGTAPPGFPKPAQNCTIESTVHDVATLKLQLKVPNNAKGFQFDFNFWSGEWPEYVCTNFNDTFIAYLKSAAFNNGMADNISFDSKKNPVSVNNGFFDRCTKNTTCNGNNLPCPGGENDLVGTGFYELGTYCPEFNTTTAGGATGWLTSTAPVKQGETITLEFMVWDTGDSIFDSTVILDNFQWIAGDTQVGTVRPPN